MAGRYLSEYEGITYDYHPNDYSQLVIYRDNAEVLRVNGSLAPAQVGREIDKWARSNLDSIEIERVSAMRAWRD